MGSIRKGTHEKKLIEFDRGGEIGHKPRSSPGGAKGRSLQLSTSSVLQPSRHLSSAKLEMLNLPIKMGHISTRNGPIAMSHAGYKREKK